MKVPVPSTKLPSRGIVPSPGFPYEQHRAGQMPSYYQVLLKVKFRDDVPTETTYILSRKLTSLPRSFPPFYGLTIVPSSIRSFPLP